MGRLIRSLLSAAATPFDADGMALLFAADRRDHIASEIRPQLERGAIVISDRFVLSSLAYQTSAGVGRDFVSQINHGGTGLLQPDLTLFVQVPVAIAADRRARRASEKEIYDDLPVQERVAAAYAPRKRRAGGEWAGLSRHRWQRLAGRGGGLAAAGDFADLPALKVR